MSKTIRDVLKTDAATINIASLWSNLRQKQYQNALSDLRGELEKLANLPNLESELRAKVERSLEKITLLIKKHQKNIA
jgi:hypothetical protein